SPRPLGSSCPELSWWWRCSLSIFLATGCATPRTPTHSNENEKRKLREYTHSLNPKPCHRVRHAARRLHRRQRRFARPASWTHIVSRRRERQRKNRSVAVHSAIGGP